MHQIPEIATITYIILAKRVAGPPHIHATRSKEKRPTSPQLSEPIIEIISAILLRIILKYLFGVILDVSPMIVFAFVKKIFKN